MPYKLRHTLAVLCAAFLFAPATAFAEKTVERGDRGPTVAKLQRLLNIHADGVFGKGTVRAVKRFQRRKGLTADGVAGPSTWRALKRGGGASGRTASRGSSVKTLQRKLRITADGVFGPGTERAVKRFQRRKGLTADGIVGPATWRALGLSSDRPVLKRKRSGGSRRSGSRLPIRVVRAIRAANRIAHKPYRLGGGHGSFSDSAYDCSGTVSYVLHAMGMLSSPLDSGSLMSYGAPGPGRYITIYANRGHAWVRILNRDFDTSARRRTGSRWTSDLRSTSGYVVRHPPGL
jgi:cell wall-associated NlpC family hydrolase